MKWNLYTILKVTSCILLSVDRDVRFLLNYHTVRVISKSHISLEHLAYYISVNQSSPKVITFFELYNIIIWMFSDNSLSLVSRYVTGDFEINGRDIRTTRIDLWSWWRNRWRNNYSGSFAFMEKETNGMSCMWNVKSCNEIKVHWWYGVTYYYVLNANSELRIRYLQSNSDVIPMSLHASLLAIPRFLIK